MSVASGIRKGVNLCANVGLALLTWALGNHSSETIFERRQKKKKRGLLAANDWTRP